MPSTKKKGPSKKAAASPDTGFPCGFCKKSFRSEQTLMVHLCVGKQRELEKDEKHVRFGLQVYRRFYEFHVKTKEPKTWTDFRQSKFYNDFVKVGRYISEINAVNTSEFVDYLVKSGIKVDKWTHPIVYETYIREWVKKETPGAAVQRNMLLMIQWATETGHDWRDFFRKVSPAQATLWIKTGRISPWVLLLCGSSQELIDRFSPEQLSIVSKYLDPGFWEIKMAKHKEDVEYLVNLFAEEGV